MQSQCADHILRKGKRSGKQSLANEKTGNILFSYRRNKIKAAKYSTFYMIAGTNKMTQRKKYKGDFNKQRKRKFERMVRENRSRKRRKERYIDTTHGYRYQLIQFHPYNPPLWTLWGPHKVSFL